MKSSKQGGVGEISKQQWVGVETIPGMMVKEKFQDHSSGLEDKQARSEQVRRLKVPPA